jgi:CRISPR/Cas system CSM-associated protein Csm3 (group 7 of RAMP superfamily)
MSGTVLPIRYTARVMIEADTPITVGTGRTGLDTDEQVALDANMLPVIPGTGLCGVLRSMAKGLVSNIEDMFGFQGKNSSEGCGSRLIISDAVMVGEGGLPQDGLSRIDWRSGFYSRFKALPIRDHCRISHTGVADAEGKGKFDEQVVFRGTRFIFEMVLQGDEQHRNDWNSLLSLLSSPLFRVGGGTRKGFGKLSTVKIEEKVFDLTQKIGLKEYLEQSSSLRDPVMSPDTVRFQESIARAKEGGYVEYDLHLVPEDFYCFGSGFGDSEVDDAFKTEEIIRWSSSGIPSFSEEMILVPATSVKGALSHRIAFHHNQINGVYSDSFSLEVEKYDDNYAVKTLFWICQRR